jgi:chromosome partitioning protein
MNPTLQILGIVVNKVDMRRNLTDRMLTEYNAAFGDTLFSTTVSNDTAIPSSHHQGVRVQELHWRSRTVGQFNKIAEEFLERTGTIHGKGVCLHQALRR